MNANSPQGRKLEADYVQELLDAIDDGNEDVAFMLAIDSIQEAADGCSVEPDGTCPHGFKAPSQLVGLE